MHITSEELTVLDALFDLGDSSDYETLYDEVSDPLKHDMSEHALSLALKSLIAKRLVGTRSKVRGSEPVLTYFVEGGRNAC